MNRLPLVLLASLLSSPFVFAQDHGTYALPTNNLIRAKSADFFYNQTATVTGKVAQVTFLPTVVILNFEEGYPNAPFTGVIFQRDTNKFSDLPKLTGQSVGLTGKVKEYQGKPEIILTNTAQLKVLEPEKK